MLGRPGLIAATRGYERRSAGVGSEEVRSVFEAGTIMIVLGHDRARHVPVGAAARIYPLTVLVAAPVAIASSIVVRFLARKLLHRAQRAGRNLRSTVVVGSAATAAELVRILEREPRAGMRVAGVCVPGRESGRAEEFGSRSWHTDDVAEVVSRLGSDAVAVTSSHGVRQGFLRELAWSLEDQSVELLVYPGMVEVAGPRLHIRPHSGLPLVQVEQPHFVGWLRVSSAPPTSRSACSPGARSGHDGDRGDDQAERPRPGVQTRRPPARHQDRRLHRPLHPRRAAPACSTCWAGRCRWSDPRPAEVDGYAFDARRRLLVTPGPTGLWEVRRAIAAELGGGRPARSAVRRELVVDLRPADPVEDDLRSRTSPGCMLIAVTTPAQRPLILFVCTGNVCRSPLAERLTEHLLGDAAEGFRVESAGTRALVGLPMDPDAAQQLAELGGNPNGLTARQLTADLLREADLVLTATRRHRSQVVELSPGAIRKVFTVRQLGRILGPPEQGRATRTHADPIHDLLSTTTQRRGLARPIHPSDDDIDDPYGRTRKDHQRSARQQVPSLETLAAFLKA